MTPYDWANGGSFGVFFFFVMVSIKSNKMKYILFNKIYINLEQFQVIPENKTQRN